MARIIAALVVLALALGGLYLWVQRDTGNAGVELGRDTEAGPAEVMELEPIEPGTLARPLAAPHATPEPTPAPEADATAELVVRVLHADGEPARVQAVLQVGEQVLDGGTSLDGTALRFPGRDGSATLWLSGATWAISGHELETASGEHEVRLPGDVEISGFVSIDGAPPRPPLLLNLSPRAEARPPSDVGRLFRRRLAGTFDTVAFAPVLTDADGRFRVSAFAPGFTGRFSPPGTGFAWAPGAEGEVAAHDHAVHLAFVTRPTLSGRLISTDGAPAGHAELDASVVFSGDPVGGFPTHGTGVSAPFSADHEGRFRIPLRREVLESVALRARHPEFGRLIWHGGPLPATVSHDVGDLVLNPARDVTWTARAADGTPIAGAVAHLAEWRKWSEPTDRAGQGLLLDVPLHDGRFEAVADGYSAALGHVASDRDEAEVVLQACTSLRVDVALADGVEPEWVELRVISHGELVVPEPDEIEHARGSQGWLRGLSATNIRTLENGDRVEARRGGGEEAPVDLQCLRPGTQVEVLLTDACGQELDRRSLILQAGQGHEVLLAVHTEPVALDLTVLDGDGRAAEGWWIGAEVPTERDPLLRNWGVGDTVDAEGRARLEGLWARALVLTAGHRDGAQGSVEVSVPAGGGSLTLVVPVDTASEDTALQLR